MILLDTNFLIALVCRDGAILRQVGGWMKEGESIQTSALAWAEFMTGPVGRDDRRHLELVLDGQIVPFGAPEAERAGRLYREARCGRAQRMDSLIAAAAIAAGGRLATRNRKDFERFVRFGLKLA